MSTRTLAPLSHAVLRPVRGETRSDTIATRVSDAIVLGVFGSGQQIPSEAELAGMFGVAQMTVRDALTSLREQGLITTRRGRGGGSFVAELAARRLLSETVGAELRDAQESAQHLTALVGHAAYLSATRSSTAENATLKAMVGEVADAGRLGTPLETAQASARVVVQLARASQSPRLTRDVINAGIEWVPFAAMALTSEGGQLIPGLLGDIVAAVTAGEPHGARLAVETYTASLFRALQSGLLRDVDAESETSSSAAARAADAMDEMLADAVLALRRVSEADRESADLADLCGSCLRQHPSLAGIGFAHAPELDHGTVEWFARSEKPDAGTVRRAIDVASDSFGAPGYEDFAWFAEPRRTSSITVVGPYVDVLCGDSYTFTIAVPEYRDSVFTGVFAADVAVSTVVQALLPDLSRADEPLALVNRHGRVTVSSDPRVASGDLLPPDTTDVRASCAQFPFHVITTPPRAS
ncbi:MAG: GntR family transcriptional regulator [Corynebacterium sp.]|uniref:GntR family transcriptional regulator n=1 Tax=Corynebacterium sp. TaxID=1720 RepID=UPI003F98040A